jgi:two-component system, NtrC family, response regulator HydG
MLPPKVEVVAIDDDPNMLDYVDEVVAQPGVRVSRFSDPLQGWNFIQRIRPDIVILDQLMPEMDGMELLRRIIEWDPTIDVVLLSGEYLTGLAVEAIQKGACDYLTKPIAPLALRERIDLLIAVARKRRRAGLLEEELLNASTFEGMIGRSAVMFDVFALVRRIAPHFRSVLVTGATGTGKELVARALHQMSNVSRKPLVVCNCAAIVESLFESELFGHVRGSFTGATQDRPGLFEAADGGVLFLDEIGEVPLNMQAKFLRALQSGEIQRVGSSVTRRVNVKVVAATNRDLRTMIRAKEFREDLFYRISTFEIKLPPLVDRKEDISLLCRHFVEYFSKQMDKEIRGLTRRAQSMLSRYSWPGNIRELENVIGHGCLMAESDLIDIGDLPEYVRGRGDSSDRQDRLTLEEVENRHVRYILEQTAGNKQLAAEILGISRATLYRFLSAQENGPIAHEVV